MPPLPGFIGPSGRTRSPNASCERTINLYAEQVESQRGTYVLYSMPGLRPVATLSSGPVRGLYEATNGRVFATTSTTLFEIFAGYTFLARGTIHTGTAPVSMVDDGQYLILSVDGVGYAYTFATDALTTLPLTGPQTFGQVVYLDGYIVTNEPHTRRFWHAEPLNPLVWPALHDHQAEGRADNVVTLLADHGQLWVFGTQTIEIWDTTGNSLAPFARNGSAFVEQGCETPWSAVALNETVYFLGGTPRGEGPVWGMQGFTPQRVSTHAMESAMSRMLTVGDAMATAARHGGHAWLVLDFPTGGATWAFDTATQAWTELAALADDGSFLPYPCNQHCSAFGEHLFGHRATGELFVWDPDFHRYGTGARLCRRTAPHVRAEQKRLRYTMFRVEAEAGIGLDAGREPGTVPQMMLRTSADGGHSWSQGRWRSMGRIGATQQQICWYQLGQHRSLAFEVTITDPMKVALLAAYLEVG